MRLYRELKAVVDGLVGWSETWEGHDWKFGDRGIKD